MFVYPKNGSMRLTPTECWIPDQVENDMWAVGNDRKNSAKMKKGVDRDFGLF